MAMVIAIFTDSTVTPVTMADYAIENKYRTKNDGTHWDFFRNAGSNYDLEYVETKEAEKVSKALSEGNSMVVASMGRISKKEKGHFTGGGHFIVLTDYTVVNGVGQFTVFDPNSKNKNYGDDGKVITSNNPGVVYADANMVSSEAKVYFIYTPKNK